MCVWAFYVEGLWVRFDVQVLEPPFRQPFQNVNRWFTTLIHQREFEAVIGTNFSMCEKMAQFDGMLSVWLFCHWWRRPSQSAFDYDVWHLNVTEGERNIFLAFVGP